MPRVAWTRDYGRFTIFRVFMLLPLQNQNREKITVYQSNDGIFVFWYIVLDIRVCGLSCRHELKKT